MKNNRRLAVIDALFPYWKQSGFRYHEFKEIFAQRSDTLFFSVSSQMDEFPSFIFPFAEFQSIVLTEGITDVYCVFLGFTLILLGEPTIYNSNYIPDFGINESLNIASFLKNNDINLHSTIYPGSIFAGENGLEFLRAAENGCKTIFTNTAEVLHSASSIIYQPVPINTNLYTPIDRDWSKPIQLVFSAHQGVRKGFPLLVEVFNKLDQSFHLHVIGDWEDHLHLFMNQNFTFYGRKNPEDLVTIYQQSHIFLNFSCSDKFALDGFPTTAALDAMATGCLLISTNPRKENLLLSSGDHYVEIVSEASAVIDALDWVRTHATEAMQIATQGTSVVQNRCNVSKIVKSKLAYMLCPS